jgi:hypothetical protein
VTAFEREHVIALYLHDQSHQPGIIRGSLDGESGCSHEPLDRVIGGQRIGNDEFCSDCCGVLCQFA